MDQEIRNKLRNVITQCRKLLEESISQELEGKYNIFAKQDQVTADPNAKMTHLKEEEQAARKDILAHFGHIEARGFKPKEALDQLVREIAFTHLNRLCAYKMMESREVYIGGEKFREAVSRGVNSNGVKFYLADRPEEERLFNTGHQDVAYRHYLDSLGGALSEEIGVLFSPNDPANCLYPRQKTLDEVLHLLNGGGIKIEETQLREEWSGIWSRDETIGWVYQYFTPKELRDSARKESPAPRNSYELAFRNQFFTPRYVVEFLTDNTLGRIWYEMRQGDTSLKEKCRYMIRRPTEVFLLAGERPPKDVVEVRDDLSQEELLKLPVYIPHRPKKDPRSLKIIDPACGSGHFLLYCFNLLLAIYEEAYEDTQIGPALQKDYSKLEDLRRDVPRLILAHNIHGIDIDLRATQIAALALWLRCQRAYQEMGLRKDRPKISRSNFVCAEPMPGEEKMLKEFIGQLEPKLLGQLVEVVFDKMTLAGEAGSLLKIEEEIRDAVLRARNQWLADPVSIQGTLFDEGKPSVEQQRFDFSGITDAQFFEQAEAKVIDTLRSYSENAQHGQRLQRRLFTDDAVRGFAFIDLCRKRFDVVLMNPPFGEQALQAVPYTNSTYPESKADLYASFVSRGVSLAHSSGVIGAITSRLALFASSLTNWRDRHFLTHNRLSSLADLGHGVLDDALVEAAAYVVMCGGASLSHINFLSALDTAEKATRLLEGVDQTSCASLTIASHGLFHSFPYHTIAYWLPSKFARSLLRHPSLKRSGHGAWVGLQTDDDFRFLRLVWECPVDEVNRRWRFFAKGGEYSPFYDDIHLSVDWKDNGNALREFIEQRYSWTKRASSADKYGLPGLTYPERTTSEFSPRPLPKGTIFSIKGQAVFGRTIHNSAAILALAYTRLFRIIVEMFVGSGDSVESGSAARDYKAGIVSTCPVPDLDQSAGKRLTDNGSRAARLARSLWSRDETSRLFTGCGVADALSLRGATELVLQSDETVWCELESLTWENETQTMELYGVSGDDKSLIDKLYGNHPAQYSAENAVDSAEFVRLMKMPIGKLVDKVAVERGNSRQLSKRAYWTDRRYELVAHQLRLPINAVIQYRRDLGITFVDRQISLTSSVISFALGCAFGRWSIESIDGGDLQDLDQDVFGELPSAAPAWLSPLKSSTQRCAIIMSNGVIPDDVNHEEDVERCVRRVFEAVWRERAAEIELEALEILGAKRLRDYFRRTGNGGFWNDHIFRYSKSRRYGPIYWLLQSSKNGYALWLYYHQLDKDMLFKALVNYVEPKIRLEMIRLESLRSQKAAAGNTGKETRRLAKDFEQQEDFLTELRDFEDKLRRAANLHLEFDLNDGVVLNMAPLWELVPWKEAKNYWDELLKGEYEWSSIGKQLRLQGLVK
jgi:hypothetical protein